MRIPRVYLDAPLRAGETLALPKPQAHHLINVLRLKNGAPLRLFNGQNDAEYLATLNIASRRHASITVTESETIQRETPLRIELVQAIATNDKIDLILQKSVELGVAAITLIHSQRSVRASPEKIRKRLTHWRQVIISATEQCGRTRLARLETAQSVDEKLTAPNQPAARYLLAPAAGTSLATAAPKDQRIQIWVGPEGGFSPEEIRKAENHGVQPVRFGPRTLRTETAGMAAITALQALHGDLVKL
ncbi:MAG TPA: 16S rRNA (uracil(1498)-N(3))-methyltransferase [Gammaproteobacteria bacterium]|nr:16S rRNA (uracil(1498)-N(3))-methyltransferase [Gammaproteobacteria bacterium]